MTLSQYLGRGSTSRGRLSITSGLTMTVSDVPYLKTADDKAAVVQGIKNLQAALAHDPQIQWLYPASNQTVEDFVDAVSDLNRRRLYMCLIVAVPPYRFVSLC